MEVLSWDLWGEETQGKPQTSIRRAGVSAEIRTKYLQNTNLERYYSSISFDHRFHCTENCIYIYSFLPFRLPAATLPPAQLSGSREYPNPTTAKRWRHHRSGVLSSICKIVQLNLFIDSLQKSYALFSHLNLNILCQTLIVMFATAFSTSFHLSQTTSGKLLIVMQAQAYLVLILIYAVDLIDLGIIRVILLIILPLI